MSTAHHTDEAEAFTPAPGRMTEEAFVAWLDGIEKPRAEWVDGDVVVMSPANTEHADLNGFLGAVLRLFVEHHDLGRVYGPEHTTRFRAAERSLRLVPDLYFVASSRLDLIRPTYLDGPPDLAVEIVSPDSQARDHREKYRDYEAAGVREYWIIDPASERVELSVLADGAFHRVEEVEGRFTSVVLPGFVLRPAWLWREPLPKVREVLRELGVA